MVEISRPSVLFSCASKADSGGTCERLGFGPAHLERAAERLAALAQVLHLRAALVEAQERHLGELLVGDRQLEAVAELAQIVLAHLLLLMGDVLAFARVAHAVALDGLGEDQRRLALVLHRRVVGGVDLERIVAAAHERPDLVVRHVGDQRLGLGRLAEEVLAHIGAVLRLVVLVLAVDRLLHDLEERARGVLGEQRVPARAPEALDDVPAGAAELGLQLLDHLAVAAHRTVEALQVAVDDEDEVIELLARREGDRARRLRLVHLAVAEERPDLAVFGVRQPAEVQILEEARLVDRHQGPEAHRDRRELPVVRHQPGMGVGREALAVDLLAEVQQLLFGEAALDEGAGVDAGGHVALDVDQVAAVVLRRGVPEVLEAGVVEERRGLEAGDVAAEFGGGLVGPQHDGERVPADDRADAVLDGAVAGMRRLLLDRDGVEIGRVGRVGDRRALAAGAVHHAMEKIMRPLRAFDLDHAVQRVEPFLGFNRVRVAGVIQCNLPVAASGLGRGAGLLFHCLCQHELCQPESPEFNGR